MIAHLVDTAYEMGAEALAPCAPPTPVGGPRLHAWGLALALHGIVAASLLWAIGPVVMEQGPALVRLVFVEPPPPPPPPVGLPGGRGAAAVLPAAPKPVVAPAKPATPPPPAPVARKAPAPSARPEQAEPVRAPADTLAGSVAGVSAGTAAGVAGGVTGGMAGGVVGGRGAGPLPAGQVAHPPQLVSRVAPQYPSAARRRGVEGLVLLEAVLDTAGRVARDVTVLESVPDLDAAAVAALRRWRFRPARDETGRTVPVILEVPIRFVLR